jgi:hypothetical protein
MQPLQAGYARAPSLFNATHEEYGSELTDDEVY